MRVALYMTTVLEQMGGFEKSLIEIANGLQEYTDIEVTLITMDKRHTQILNNLLSVYFSKNLRNITESREQTKAISKLIKNVNYKRINSFNNLRKELGSYDLIYSKNELIEAFIFKFILNYKRLPPIIFLCGTALYYPKAKSVTSKLHNFLYLGWCYRFLASGVYGFHAKNQYDLALLKKLFPQNQLANVPNPFDFREMDRLSKTKLQLQGYNPKKMNILWAARLTEQKGIDRLIKIIQSVNESCDDKITWWIAGEGEDSAKLKSTFKNKENIKLLGHIPSSKMPGLYKSMDLFLMTSYWESFGNTIIEAGYFNTPTIAYDIPGPNNIINNNVNGYLVSNTDQFIECLTNQISSGVKLKNIAKFFKETYDVNPLSRDLYNLFELYLTQSKTGN